MRGPSNKGNPDLAARNNRHLRIGAAATAWLSKQLRFTTFGLYCRIDDLVSQQTDPTDGLLAALHATWTGSRRAGWKRAVIRRGISKTRLRLGPPAHDLP